MVLDSIGGIVVMGELYKKVEFDMIVDIIKKVFCLVIVDMWVDYFVLGCGKYFIVCVEILRLGWKGCIMCMIMVNDEGKLIVIVIVFYVY